MAEPIDPVRDADEGALEIARALMRGADTAALAYLAPETGAPGIARIGFGRGPEGEILSLLSDLAAHTRALRADPRASLLVGVVGPKGDPLNSPRLSISARVTFVAPEDAARDTLRAAWLQTHPKAKLYVDFADFHFVRFIPVSVALNGGFGRAFRITPTDIAPA